MAKGLQSLGVFRHPHASTIRNRLTEAKLKLIDISTRKYPNTFTMVDDADFDWLNQWKWHKKNDGYARRSTSRKGVVKNFLMHREILQLPSGVFCDHKNGNTLDNRRQNIRPCNHAENMFNKSKPPSGATSKFKGVSWHIRMRHYRARIKKNQIEIHIGCFDSELEAALAYDAKAIEIFGVFARPNFPQDHIEVSRLPAGSGMNEG